MSFPSVQVINVSKFIGGKLIIKNMSLSVYPGEILGLIGPNGAGKTTFIRIIATVLTPEKGQLYLMGIDTQKAGPELRQKIGYMPEDAGHYLRLTAGENLKFYLSFYSTQNNTMIIEYFLRKLNLWQYKDLPVGKYSQGMKRKLLFIRSILHTPFILLLDEPFTSMDPESRLTCRQIFKEYICIEKRCIIISSHSLSELENICDRIVLISAGKKLLDEKVQTVQKRYEKFTVNKLEDLYMTLIKR